MGKRQATAVEDRRLNDGSELFVSRKVQKPNIRFVVRRCVIEKITVAAYERAAAIYPGAQSPRLALSELAARAGERTVAAPAALAAIAVTPDRESADPWWSYHVAAGRSVTARLNELLALLERGR